MSKNKINSTAIPETNFIEVKSKFDAEFRRFSFKRNDEFQNFEKFSALIEQLHRLSKIQFIILYVDPSDNALLPINNDDNFGRAIKTARPLLRVIVQRKDDFQTFAGFGTAKAKNNIIGSLLGQSVGAKAPPISIPRDFHHVSAIIDFHLVPETHRRVRLLKYGSDKPLGFYIRDGTSVRVTANGLDKQPGIFISRLVPGGLAESTGLLAVNDEVVEVNGIEVAGKTLDQVTDMMVANSSNLIITVKPANQRTLTSPRRGSFSRNSQLSSGSHQTNHTNTSDENEQDEQDEVVDLTGVILDDHATSNSNCNPNNNNNNNNNNSNNINNNNNNSNNNNNNITGSNNNIAAAAAVATVAAAAAVPTNNTHYHHQQGASNASTVIITPETKDGVLHI